MAANESSPDRNLPPNEAGAVATVAGGSFFAFCPPFALVGFALPSSADGEGLLRGLVGASLGSRHKTRTKFTAKRADATKHGARSRTNAASAATGDEAERALQEIRLDGNPGVVQDGTLVDAIHKLLRSGE